ncbi:Histone-lysine N-methyltransferase SETD1B-A [Merluccius polli]|uniref:Histone-lysine N-methyltransferase SETD1B-A n=1 Tax=Merluccius polli TaxID=89951 RepID=A0AA47N5J5_MERPO|nr:Histone-lysine N-methyltransferase SETD1B-A [Merluccius polli]
MESEQQSIERKTAPQQWKSCKLIIDPLLTNGLYKVYRFDGQSFNIPVDDLGLFPVETLCDPRVCRLWSKCKGTELAVPKFKIDDCYVGPIPPKEVTFARLNDNVKEAFLTEMCKKYGQVDEVEIFYNPKTIKHLGIGKVIFDTVKAARDAVQHLHETSVMGNIIHVEVDPNGGNRKRYLQLLVDGLYTPCTLPVGSNEQTLQSLIDNLPGCKPPGRESFICSPTSISTPLSLDTAYSSICQDTPQSFGLTPRSQGTPRTPYLSGTPLSQDSCYSSLQATPVQQGEPPTHAIHNVSRREVYYRKPGRHNGRYRKGSDLSYIFKHFRPQPLLPLFSQTPGAGSDLQPALCSENSPPSGGDPTDPSFNFLPSRARKVVVTTISLNYNSPALLLSTNGVSDREDGTISPPAYHPCITELPLSPVNASPRGLRDESESLDSRIEMLLNKSHNAGASFSSTLFDGDGTEGVEEPQEASAAHHSSKYFPASDLTSFDSTSTSGGSLTPSHNPATVSPSPLPVHGDSEEDEIVQAVASLLRDTQSPTLSHLTHTERRGNNHHGPLVKDTKRLKSEDHYVNQDKKGPASRRFGAFASKGTSSLPPPLSSFPGTAQIPANPFRFSLPSIPPSVPLFPLRLPNGTIPFPPPRWLPPPSLCQGSGIPRPPPSIPPPPSTLLGPRPTLMAPPAAVVHPGHSYSLHVQPGEHLDISRLPGQTSSPWPSLPLPCFNPFMPPPGYMPMREDPHTVTMEKVLEVFMKELWSIIKKDITRKMVEGVAFKAFDKWWDEQEQKSKVKRKEALDPCTSEAPANTHHTSLTHQHKSQSENTELEKICNADKRKSEEADAWSGSCSALRRKHARPLLLDTDDDEAEEVGDAQKNEDVILHQEEEDSSVADGDAALTQYNINDHDEMENEDVQRQTGQTDVEEVIPSKSLSEVHSSSEEDTEGSSVSDSESTEGSSVSDSESTEGSSNCDLSSEEQEEEEQEYEGYILISSDEELMDLEAPTTPQTPLTPGAQLELTGPQEWSQCLEGESPGKDQYTALLDPGPLQYPFMQGKEE